MPPNPESPEPGAGRGGLLWLALFALLAAGSLTQGLINAWHHSQDFQWSGVWMLLHRIDPWTEYLRGDPNHLIHLSQIPNYLPVLYTFLIPLGLVPMGPASLIWALLNVIFAAAGAWLAARFYGLGPRATFLAVCLLFMATPTRQTIGNGQHGLVVLFIWAVSLATVRVTNARAATAGISYLKFNFAPPVFLYLFLENGVRAVLFSLVPSAAATMLWWVWLTHGHNPHELLSLITGPLAVSRTGYFPSGGDPNLMDVLQVALYHSYQPGTFMTNVLIPAWVNAVTLGSALAACFAVLFFARKRRRNAIQWHLALMATASVAFFKHHPYDSVVLAIPLCYALAHWRRRAGKVAVFALAYGWYLQKGAELTALFYPSIWKYLFFLEFAAVVVLLCAVYRLGAFQPTGEPLSAKGSPVSPTARLESA